MIRRGLVMTIKTLFAALMFGAATLVPTMASAEVQVIADSYSPPEVFGGIRVESINYAQGGTTGRFLVTTRDTVSGVERDLYTFCIDVTQGLYTFVDFVDSPLSAAFPNALKQAQIAGLLTFGNPLIDAATSPADKSAIAAALGLSIWEVLYEGSTSGYDVLTGNFNVYGDFVPLAGRANSYLALATSGAWSGDVGRVRTLIDATGASQNQVYLGAAALGGVPEPTTWAMLILGFGIIGGAMRQARRRRQAIAAG
jgi:hypothetical protein